MGSQIPPHHQRKSTFNWTRYLFKKTNTLFSISADEHISKLCKYMEVWKKKWLTFCRQHFQINGSASKPLHLNLIEVCSKGSNGQVIIGSENGLVPPGNKPLPEPMMADIYDACVITWSRWVMMLKGLLLIFLISFQIFYLINSYTHNFIQPSFNILAIFTLMYMKYSNNIQNFTHLINWNE